MQVHTAPPVWKGPLDLPCHPNSVLLIHTSWCRSEGCEVCASCASLFCSGTHLGYLGKKCGRGARQIRHRRGQPAPPDLQGCPSGSPGLVQRQSLTPASRPTTSHTGRPHQQCNWRVLTGVGAWGRRSLLPPKTCTWCSRQQQAQWPRVRYRLTGQ